ncbi:MAG: nucleoside-diphosphate kinase [Bacteroidales bacterium]
MKERTLSMIKPLAVQKGYIAPILDEIHNAGFRICAMKMIQLTHDHAKNFYNIHADKAFFNTLVDFMSSGPIVAVALEKENAVEDFRKIIGDTDPAKAPEHSIRAKYARDITHNAIHGSDSVANAKKEIGFFFAETEIY